MPVKLSPEQIDAVNALHREISQAENGLNAVLRNADGEGNLPDAVLVPLRDGLARSIDVVEAIHDNPIDAALDVVLMAITYRIGEFEAEAGGAQQVGG